MGIDDMLKESEQEQSIGLQWRGYNRREVDAQFARLAHELEVLRTDRDAAVATAQDLTRQLEEARRELGEYRVLHAGYSKENTVSGCIRYLIHVAKQRAEAVEAAARERSDSIVRQAEEVAARQAALLDETEQESQRRLAEATRRAQEIVKAALAESRGLVAELVERQQVLDRWAAELGEGPDVPIPRTSTPPGGTPRAEATQKAMPAVADAG